MLRYDIYGERGLCTQWTIQNAGSLPTMDVDGEPRYSIGLSKTWYTVAAAVLGGPDLNLQPGGGQFPRLGKGQKNASQRTRLSIFG